METRPYFVFGDLISNLATGAFVGGLCTVIVTLNWEVSIAMVVGMAIGMAVSLPAGVLLGSLFGALEVFLPVMTTGMVAGMVVGMRSSMAVIAFVDAVWIGGACGVGIVIVTYLANIWIQRGAQRWTT